MSEPTQDHAVLARDVVRSWSPNGLDQNRTIPPLERLIVVALDSVVLEIREENTKLVDALRAILARAEDEEHPDEAAEDVAKLARAALGGTK